MIPSLELLDRTPGQPGRVRLGIIGGVGPAATVGLYQSIVDQFRARADGHHPDLVVHSLPLSAGLETAFVSGRYGRSDERTATGLLELGRDVLVAAGAGAIVVACNTLHRYLPPVLDAAGVAWVDIVGATVTEIGRLDVDRIGLLASTATVRSSLYSRPLDRLGVRVVTPPADDQQMVAEAILRSAHGEQPGATAAALRPVVDAMARRVDVVLLGCTDLYALATILSGPTIVDSLTCLATASTDLLLRAPYATEVGPC